MNFDRSLDVVAGQDIRLSPLISRVLAPNPGPFTFKGTGVYIVGAGPHVAIIDPGPDVALHLKALEHALDGRRLSHILVTHAHRDHSSAVGWLKAFSGAKTYGLAVPAKDNAAPAMADEARDDGFVPDVHVQDGLKIVGDGFTITCVTTPGHTADHVCYGLDEERALFSGDHVMGWSTSVIAPPDGHMGQYLASLDKLMRRDDRIFYPTHGSPITDPHGWLVQLINHRIQRERQILDAIHQGHTSIDALTQILYRDLAPALKQAAALQIKAHLDHLAEQGLVIGDAGG